MAEMCGLRRWIDGSIRFRANKLRYFSGRGVRPVVKPFLAFPRARARTLMMMTARRRASERATAFFVNPLDSSDDG